MAEEPQILRLAGHNISFSTDRCLRCDKSRWQIIVDRQCCVGTNADYENLQLDQAKEDLWRAIVEVSNGGGRGAPAGVS